MYIDYDITTEFVERSVVRSGKPVAFVYLAYFESDTTFCALNEVFKLFNLPQFDIAFRNSLGKIRPNLVFIVDNGHGEDPTVLLHRCA